MSPILTFGEMAKPMGKILAERVKAERKRQGLTQQELVDRLGELGYPMNRVTLLNIEKGGDRARNVTLEEAFGLAAALSVPPSVLFLGLGVEAKVMVLPKMVVHPDLASKWLEGLENPATTGRYSWKLAEWKRAAMPVFLYHALRKAQDRMHQADTRVHQAEYAGTEEELRQARSLEVKALEELAEVIKSMNDRGVQVPAMPEWIAKIKQLGLKV
jgi:transcriptional regulator with XRE-family HTH domain